MKKLRGFVVCGEIRGRIFRFGLKYDDKADNKSSHTPSFPLLMKNEEG